MRVIRIFDVLLQYIFIFVFAGSLVGGVFNWHWFIVGGAALLCYFIWGIWRLRCPWCHGPIELNELLMGRRRTCHCPACGHEITVVVRLGKPVPRPGPDLTPAREPEEFDEPEEPEEFDEPDELPEPEEPEPEELPEPVKSSEPGVETDRAASIEAAVMAILGPDTGRKDGTAPARGSDNTPAVK